MYAHWPQRVGPAEICRVQPPGRENRLREPHYGTYPALAEALAEYLRPYLDRPFAFFGHCSSALAGYETARYLQRTGGPVPARLFISSQSPPHLGPHGRFLRMSDDELAEEMAVLTRAMGGEPDPEMIRLGLGVMRADVEANKRYELDKPDPLLTPITVIGWLGDTEVPPELMTEWHEYAPDVRFITLQGEHHSFLRAPLALRAELAHDMEAAL